jgi:hypothetical protein
LLRARMSNRQPRAGHCKSVNGIKLVSARQDGSTMVFHKEHHSKRRHATRRFDESPEIQDPANAEHTGAEATYLKSLIDSHAKVTVVLNSGERFHGRLRYYDRHCFSIGVSPEGPKIFLRKSCVSYISEE